MSLPKPFIYPSEPHAYGHGPKGYENYASYKPFLRDEFLFRCTYCLEREMWYPNRSAGFGVDHFTPKSEKPELETVYENLIYACNRCNSFKQADAVLPNPADTAYGGHLRVRPNGTIDGVTTAGKKIVQILHLNDGPAFETRQTMLQILEAKRKHADSPEIDKVFRKYFGFPPDLPDLRLLKPPRGNEREKAASSCFFVKREAGELPDFY